MRIAVLWPVGMTLIKTLVEAGIIVVENVFQYFFMIGAGLALGMAVIVLPAIWLVGRMKQRKGAGGNVRSY